MIIESISGNIHDLPSEELEGVHVENVVLPLADLTKRIQRVRSDHGTELGIRLAPGAPDLREGDILLRDERGIVVVRLEPTDVLVIAPATVREMGVVAHNLGNRHLPAQFFGPEEPFPDLEGHAGVMVIQPRSGASPPAGSCRWPSCATPRCPRAPSPTPSGWRPTSTRAS